MLRAAGPRAVVRDPVALAVGLHVAVGGDLDRVGPIARVGNPEAGGSARADLAVVDRTPIRPAHARPVDLPALHRIEGPVHLVDGRVLEEAAFVERTGDTEAVGA